MKRLFLFLSIISVLLASCDKTPANGDLDGKWLLKQRFVKETATDGAYSRLAEGPADTKIYWSFQLQLLSITSGSLAHNGQTGETVARFVREGNRLSVTQTYVHFRDRDELISDPSTTLLEVVGIRSNASDFRIALLNSSRLTLCSQLDSLVFVKLH